MRLAETRIIIRRFEDGRMLALDKPFSVSEIHGNVGLQEGITELLNLLVGAAASAFHSGMAHIGVGTYSGAVSSNLTGLRSSLAYGPMDATFPIVSGVAVAWRSTFLADQANDAWNEFTVANASGNAAKNLFIKVYPQGTKFSGQSWEVRAEVSIT